MTCISKISEPPVTTLGDKLRGAESIFDAAPIGLCVLDLSFRYMSVNACFAQMYGLPKAAFLGRTVEQALPGPASQIVAHLNDALAANGIVEREIALEDPHSKPNQTTPCEVIYLRTAQPIHDDCGTVYGISVALLDITQRKRAIAALLESEENLRYTVELTPHIPWTADASGELTFMSPRWNTITGKAAGLVHLKDWASVLHPEDLDATAAFWSSSVQSGEPYDAEYRICSANGGWRWVRARAYPRRNGSGEIVQWYGTVEDVHDRKGIAIQLAAANEELARHAREDHLTGLPNRRRFDEVLGQEVERARRNNRPMALILLDIDYFKHYNDAAGHLAGDECLKMVANAVGSVIRRPTDLAARFGGEEFAIILPETSPQGADEIASRAVAAIRNLVITHPDPRIGQVTISAGVAVHIGGAYPSNFDCMEEFVATADMALYEAKAKGRDRFISRNLRNQPEEDISGNSLR